MIASVFDVFADLLTHFGLECPDLNIDILVFGIFAQKEQLIVDGDDFYAVLLLHDLFDGIEEFEVVDWI